MKSPPVQYSDDEARDAVANSSAASSTASLPGTATEAPPTPAGAPVAPLWINPLPPISGKLGLGQSPHLAD